MLERDMRKYFVLLTMLVLLALQAEPIFGQKDNKPEKTAAAAASPGKNQDKAEPPQAKKTKAANKGGEEALPEIAPPERGQRASRQEALPQDQTRLDKLERAFGEQRDNLAQQKDDLHKLQTTLGVSPEGSASAPDNLGPLGWFTSPLAFWTAALLFILSIALHAVHMLKDIHTGRVLGQLWNAQQRSATASRSAVPGKNNAVESLTEQVREQGQGLSQFTAQMGQLQNHLVERDKQFADTVQAVALTANWVGQSQFRDAATADGGQISEADRASAIALLERYEEPLRSNAGRVEPLAQAMAALVERLEAETQLPQDLVSRAQSLHHDIGQFDLWQTSVSEQLASLRRGSFSKRSAMLQADQQRLVEQVNAGNISIAQMVHKSRELLDQHFPRNAQKSSARLPSVEDENELRKRVASAPEFLMDWFDSFSQFQSQAMPGQATRVQLDADIMNRLVQIQGLAREILGKFDIQPEEIQVGRTSYDRRLHEATLARQSLQFPINTVIEVLRCGFRRMSTGEVLRRPQVVVARETA
jgi:molecular chaperone GrpE (heat shock protein)